MALCGPVVVNPRFLNKVPFMRYDSRTFVPSADFEHETGRAVTCKERNPHHYTEAACKTLARTITLGEGRGGGGEGLCDVKHSDRPTTQRSPINTNEPPYNSRRQEF